MTIKKQPKEPKEPKQPKQPKPQASLIALCDLQLELDKKNRSRVSYENILFCGDVAYTHNIVKTLQSLKVDFITNTENLEFLVNASKLKQVLSVCDNPQIIIEFEMSTHGYKIPVFKIKDGLGVWVFPISSTSELKLFNESLPEPTDIIDSCQISKENLLYLINTKIKSGGPFGIKYIQYYKHHNQKPFLSNCMFGELLNFKFDFKVYQNNIVFKIEELVKSKKTILSFGDVIECKIIHKDGNDRIVFNNIIEIVIESVGGFLSVEICNFDKNHRQIKMTLQDIKNLKQQFKGIGDITYKFKEFCLMSDSFKLKTETKCFTKGIYNHYTKNIAFDLVHFVDSFTLEKQLHFFATEPFKGDSFYIYTKTKNNTIAFCMNYKVTNV